MLFLSMLKGQIFNFFFFIIFFNLMKTICIEPYEVNIFEISSRIFEKSNINIDLKLF